MSPPQKLALTQSRSLVTHPVSGYRFAGIGCYSFLRPQLVPLYFSSAP